jgi:hypothetical protein
MAAKTTLIESVLSLFEQLLEHERGLTEIQVLKVLVTVKN